MPLTSKAAPDTMADVKKLARPAGRPRSAISTAFASWLDAHGWSREAAAKELGFTRGQVDKLARGEALPSIVAAWSIHVFTKGGVSLKEWAAVAMSRQKASKGSARPRRKG